MSEIVWTDQDFSDAHDGTATLVAPFAEPVDEAWRAAMKAVMRRRRENSQERMWPCWVDAAGQAMHIDGFSLDDEPDEYAMNEFKQEAIDFANSVVAETDEEVKKHPTYIEKRRREALERMRRGLAADVNA
jgi:hypothetical protein